PAAEVQQASKTSTPTVSTHGQYLPGVTVNAKGGPVLPQPHTPQAMPAAAAAAAHAFLPGVTMEAKQIVTPGRVAAPKIPVQAPPAPEQSRDTGMGV
ncbi:hypothetical protein ABZT34_07295, partial [Streptomyces sp. NPDC005329]